MRISMPRTGFTLCKGTFCKDWGGENGLIFADCDRVPATILALMLNAFTDECPSWGTKALGNA